MFSRALCLALLLWSSRAVAGAGIRVSVPEHVLLGEDREAEVRIELEPSATDVELFVSRGEVGPLTRVSPGVFRAVYTPPRQKLPQVVIVAALARGPQGVLEGWTTLPLWGQGVAEVRTRAGEPVTLLVGTKPYGPFFADPEGLARIPVAVPPGVHEAFFGSKRIDLGLPPQPFVHALVERREVRADREESVNVRLYAVKPEDATQPPGPLTLSASRGTVSAPVEVGPGVSIAKWTVPAGKPGALELKGLVPGDRRPAFSVRLEVVPGPAQRFEMKVDREELVASEEARVAVEVSARDGMGNPTKAGLRLESDLGEGVTLTERQPGEYAGVLGIRPGFGGRERLELRLLADGGASPVLTRTVALRPAAPARVTVEPSLSFFVANGRSEASWRVSVADRFGNPVPEPWPEAVAVGGPPITLVSRERGTYELRYVPPPASEDHLSELNVRVGEALGRGSVSLLRRRPVLQVGPRVGMVTNFADVLAPSVGVRLEVWPTRPLADLGLMLDAGYLRFSNTGGGAVPGFTGRDEWLDITGAVALRTSPKRRLQSWVAAGPSLVRVRGSSRLGEGPALEEAAWVLGAQALVGVGLPLGPGQPFLEASFRWFDDPGLHVLRGALRGGGLHVGYRLELL